MTFIKDESYLEHLKSVKLLKTRSLNQQIYKILLTLITKGVLRSNVLLLEGNIAQALNISKTPVREALKKLEGDELVKILPQSRTYVLPISIEKVSNLHKIREALELLMVREAINYVKQEDFLIFDNLIKKQREALEENDFDKFFEHDEAFHAQIAKSGKMLEAWKILSKVKIVINRVRWVTKNNYSWNSSVIEEHRNILYAIKNRNLEVAKLQMVIHLSRVSSTLTQSLIEKKVKI